MYFLCIKIKKIVRNQTQNKLAINKSRIKNIITKPFYIYAYSNCNMTKN